MNPRILNRDFQHPADGWYQIEPIGEHPNRRAGLVQVIDEESAASIVERFNADADAGQLSHGHELLIDHEHFKHDANKETVAYGWLQKLQNRADGIYGQVRWTATGKQSVDGGDYRFFSTEYDPGDLKLLNDGNGKVRRVRPLRLDGLTLTNEPNNKGGKPITNRLDSTFADSRELADSTVNTNTKTKMKSVCTLLGLSADADEASVHATVTKLLNRADITPAALTTLQDEHKSLGLLNQTLLGEQIDGLLAEHGIKDEKVLNRLKPVLTPLKNRAERLACLADFGFKPGEQARTTAAAGTQNKLFNRDTKPPGGGADTAADSKTEKSAADKIMNRARDLQKSTPHLSLATAVRMAQNELAAS